MSVTSPTRFGRTVLWGGTLIAVGVVQFSAAMAWVQSQYPGYSLLTNYISDLGNTSTSPAHAVFNVSIMVLGLLAFLGTLLAWGGFPRGGPRVAGLFLILVASVAAVLVGVFPENVNPTVHDLVSLLVFLPGGLGLCLLSLGMRAGTFWSSYRGLTLGLGAITLVSLAYYAPTQQWNITWDPGLVERLIVFPILVWGFVAGLRLVTLPRYSPSARPSSP